MTSISARQTVVTIGVLAMALAVLSGAMYGVLASGQTNVTIDPDSKQTLTISGVGEVKIKPDRAKIMLGAVTEGLTVKEAAERNAEIVNNLIKLLEQLGISKESMETSSYNIYPINEYTARGFPIIVGYRVEHSLQVTVLGADVNQLAVRAGQVIDAAIAAEANQVHGIQFTVSDEMSQQLRNEALEKAVRDAAAKGKLMSSALGVQLVGVLSVSESGGFFPPPIFFARAEEVKQGTPILPGTLSVSASVQVTYLIG